MLFVYISETLLYLCFSLLIGTFVIALIPASKRPPINIGKRWLQGSILGIVLFSMFPIIRLVLYLYEDIGLLLTVQNILTDFEIGKAWIYTLYVSIVFYLYVSIFPVQVKRLHTFTAIIFTIALALLLGWASHSASLTEWSGFVVHSVHFLAVITWVGILLVVSWFSFTAANWLSFLNWYTPVAFASLAVIIVSGIFMMNLVVEINDYPNSWIVPYGQALLIKHLIIVPILVFALVNGFIIKRKLHIGISINPLPWVRSESIFLLLIFSATAVLGQQEPPHNIESMVTSNGMSKVFNTIYMGPINAPINADLNITVLGCLFFLISLCFATLIGVTLKKKASILAVFLLSLLLAFSLYLGMMNSVSF
ncbi:copper resistance protein CopD [Tetzosporium hominis]|uniref:Copper resistance protein CopD n=1 Tax=Tetzosporium hominis TaxID=2020506 RepID=A0A264W6M4_9BACL|nr:CopD family protein [Tetzosporium hominis]OZS78677.1 copper resistance protein CopD [Tetzosporium hominis]